MECIEINPPVMNDRHQPMLNNNMKCIEIIVPP